MRLYSSWCTSYAVSVFFLSDTENRYVILNLNESVIIYYNSYSKWKEGQSGVWSFQMLNGVHCAMDITLISQYPTIGRMTRLVRMY